MSKKAISATLDPDLLDRLDAIVEETERNRSWLISKAIESYLEELEDIKIAKERMSDDRLSSAELRKKVGL
jgi:predicted DNA-binding protein